MPRLQAERGVERHSVPAELPCPEHLEAARPDVPAGFRRERAHHPARPSAAAARKVRALQATEEAVVAQRLARGERLVPPALQAEEAAGVREAQQVPPASAAQPTAAAEAEVTAGRQPAAEPAEAERRREVAAVQDVAAAVQRPAAGPASVAARPRGAEVAAPDAAEVRLREAEVVALDAAEVPLREAEAGAPDAAGVRRRVVEQDGAQGARLLAAAWAELPSTRQQGDRPAPSARPRSAHARRRLRTAQP